MRGKGEGAVYKRASDGRWCASIELPARPGHPRPRKVITSKDKATVIRKLAALVTELEANGEIPTDNQTLEQWLTYWLRGKRRTVTPKTWDGYDWMIRKYITPTIGKVRLSRLGPADVRRLHDTMLTGGLSSTSAGTAHRILSSALSAAVNEGRIARNAAKRVESPPRRVTTLQVLTVPQVASITQNAASTSEGVLWATYLLTGARRGEILGLEWDRVGDGVDLSWQLQRHRADWQPAANYEYRHLRGSLYLTRPKSRAGWRVIPLVDPLRTILETWRRTSAPNRYGLVFTTGTGTPLDPDNVTKRWTEAVAALGIDKPIRLHDLRHTAVTLLYDAGVPEATIVQIVGHSSVTMTRGYQAKGDRQQLTAAMMRMSELLSLPADD